MNEALRQQWLDLAEDIEQDDPEAVCQNLWALRAHAQLRVAEYTQLIEKEAQICSDRGNHMRLLPLLHAESCFNTCAFLET